MVATLLNTFDTEWIGVIHEQAPQWFKGYIDETIRRRILLAYMRKYGRIVLGCSSSVCVWNLKFAQQPIEATGDAGKLVFNRHDLQRQAALNWRGYVGTDAMTEKEYLMNAGPARILNRYGETIPWLMEAMTDHFSGELILDGNAPGRENNIHGMESFLAPGTVTANDMIALPSDSYAGLSTALQSEGGSWSSSLPAAQRPNTSLAYDWPHGKGSANFDFNSPKLLNASSNRWGGGANTWAANCERIIRQGVIWLTSTGGSAGMPKCVMLSNNWYADYLNHQAAKQRIVVPHKESEDLGFSDTVNQEGVAIKFDYDIPPSTGYLFNVANAELCSLDKVLFGYRGPDWSISDRAWLFYVGFWGNARYRPKHFGKIANYA